MTRRQVRILNLAFRAIMGNTTLLVIEALPTIWALIVGYTIYNNEDPIKAVIAMMVCSLLKTTLDVLDHLLRIGLLDVVAEDDES